VYFNYHLIIDRYLTLNEHYSVTYIHTEDKFKILNYLGDKQDSTGMGLRVQV
jgi:hypothetical protein